MQIFSFSKSGFRVLAMCGAAFGSNFLIVPKALAADAPLAANLGAFLDAGLGSWDIPQKDQFQAPEVAYPGFLDGPQGGKSPVSPGSGALEPGGVKTERTDATTIALPRAVPKPAQSRTTSQPHTSPVFKMPWQTGVFQ